MSPKSEDSQETENKRDMGQANKVFMRLQWEGTGKGIREVVSSILYQTKMIST